MLLGVVLIGPLLLFILAKKSVKCGLQPGDLLPEARLESLDGVPGGDSQIGVDRAAAARSKDCSCLAEW
jgi:hypothetical protein